MSDNYSDTLHGAPPTPPADPSRPQVAKDEAGVVGRTATDAGKQVAGTAADQAAQVGQQARRQAKDLFAQARDQATDQARTGQRKAGESLSALASELHEMAGTGDRSGPASDLAKQAAERLESASSWLGEREPGDLLTEFRGLARRRPGAFLLGAAAAGLLVGRLTRGAIDANRDTDGPSTPVAPAIPPAAPQPPVTYREPQATTPSPVDPLDPGAQWTDPGHSPAHAPRPGATTVGEYVDEINRGGAPQYPSDRR